MKFYQLYYCFAVHECESIEVTEGESWALGLYERTDDWASAPTKKSTWKHPYKDQIIFNAGSTKEWRLGETKHKNTDNYDFNGTFANILNITKYFIL